MYPIFKGLLIGFSIAAPVGPIGLLCIRRSLNEGRWQGFASGLGAAAADTVYGFIAAFGITAVSSVLLATRGWLNLVGGLFLVYLGWRTFRIQPPPTEDCAPRPAAGSAFFSTFLLTLMNPMTVLAFVGIFAGLGAGGSSPASAGLLVLGVFLGSTIWWLLLSSAASWMREYLHTGRIQFINRCSGVVLAAFGAVQLVHALPAVRL